MVNSNDLYDYAEAIGLDVVEDSIPKHKVKALIIDDLIILDKSIDTESERASILAEEIGHYETSCGNILDQSKHENVKQEVKARRWAHSELVPLSKLIECYESKCRNKFEAAEYIGVTEEFFEEAVEQYELKYGDFVEFENYYICFSPLGVIKKVDEMELVK